jgi:hypothetical protein
MDLKSLPPEGHQARLVWAWDERPELSAMYAANQGANKDDQGHEVAQDEHEPKPGDSPAVAAWRRRMAGDEAKALYKQRAATAEGVNARARNRGLQRLPVRGLKKVRCVALLFAPAHNLMRALALAPQLLGLGTTASAAAVGTV